MQDPSSHLLVLPSGAPHINSPELVCENNTRPAGGGGRSRRGSAASWESPGERLTVVLRVLLEPVLAAALHSGGVRAAVAGHGAAGSQLAVDRAAGVAVLRPRVPGLGVRLDARGVGAAMAGGGVPGQAPVLPAARAAPAGPGPLFQLVHVEVQAVTDVRLPVLLLLCVVRSRARRYSQPTQSARPGNGSESPGQEAGGCTPRI